VPADYHRNTVLIDVPELAALIQAKSPIVLLDTRFDVDRKNLRPTTPTPHIPGAIYVNLATELSGESTPSGGRRPLPNIHDLQRDARRWGIQPDSQIVVYDEISNSSAARAWWILRWAGLANVRLLDGGLTAWIAAGNPITLEAFLPVPGKISLRSGKLPVLEADDAADLARTGVLLDARGLEAYLGAPAEAGKPPSGHIPGAISAPAGETVTSLGGFKPALALQQHFAALGVDGARQIGVYCGSGVAAAQAIAALASIGLEAALYVGSWSAWSAEASRPVAIGAKPSHGN
jgi:thiosulfate/3-mercaptopyruvate sulfurtransferase